MKITYNTQPLPQYVHIIKAPGMLRARTEYNCPLCNSIIPKRDFDEHVYKSHANRVDECFARLLGLQYPVKCSGCNKELHYNSTYHGFPKTCSNCISKDSNGSTEYKNSQEAHEHVKKLEQQLAEACLKEKEMKEEEETLKKPLTEFPFPSMRYNSFMRRLSLELRTHAINFDKDRLLEICNLIDKLGINLN